MMCLINVQAFLKLTSLLVLITTFASLNEAATLLSRKYTGKKYSFFIKKPFGDQ